MYSSGFRSNAETGEDVRESLTMRNGIKPASLKVISPSFPTVVKFKGSSPEMLILSA